ncbi:bifunctional indole-3-glycerol-phosphate synthase TrpC/phosphoribosylanthranilate isomerase TrpF [Sphingosinicella sp. CPCC 101087]|uniref:bifunctional indole-3-glycerol-phosphate synthase TrpC/phosphoribosylanthranilate isomerase TrpF n=1 Tax=Sphingosinicella sp. CPCC 101087 TaxID=2497754 RepID=UPI00101DFEF4|nr:bifunctional indole-3-glycerol-phosphate synthase TrpC/phosphoribosylanthranilate isomerase TrpF [Sphingosinicella sp. CPCC 101087]
MADPDGVLGEIVARKRKDVTARLGTTSLADLRGRAQRTTRRMGAALARPGARFVMEVKRASPSGGALRAEVDPAAQARAYAGAADAVSVLTDAPFFDGSLADLETVRRAFDGPVLAKDFIVDPRQVPEARIAGADAVLVMLSVLDDAAAAEVMREAEMLGMDALVEAHDAGEVRRAVALGSRIIGINNRNLRTLEVDLATTERLAGLVPDDRLLVAESGIADRGDVERLGPHADAFLVGSSLMRADRPAQAARALAFGRVKVCGLRDPDDARAAARSGAAIAGVVMVPGTPRAVTIAEAEPTAEAARESGVALAGVFRNAKLLDVADAARALGLDAVQLHGEEDAAYIRGLRPLLPQGTEIWAAGAVGRDVPEPRLGADRTLFDTKTDGRTGGTGIAFDWSRLSGRSDLGRALLAGGLDPANARAASKVGAWALDVCSGVEAEPGRKDPDRIAAFFEAVRPRVRGEVAPC